MTKESTGRCGSPLAAWLPVSTVTAATIVGQQGRASSGKWVSER